MLSWRGAEEALPVSDDREADTLEQEPGPAESAPGITPQRPGKPWHPCPHLLPSLTESFMLMSDTKCERELSRAQRVPITDSWEPLSVSVIDIL